MFLFTLYKNKKCAEKRNFRTSCAVLDAVLNSDDDSDEIDSSDWEIVVNVLAVNDHAIWCYIVKLHLMIIPNHLILSLMTTRPHQLQT